jgi:glycosyltransferase involved in cell wall biosynthesis
MRAGSPLVTAVLPCFNQARYLPRSIGSVHRQTHQPIEIIVVDDGSTDDTSAVATRLGARVVRQANAGLSAARNAGLAVATGPLVVFLDADDEFVRDAVESGVSMLRSHPGATCAVGWCAMIDDDGRPLPSRRPELLSEDLYREWLRSNFVWTPGAAIFRTPRLRALGGFPAGVGPAADYGVYLALARAGEVVLDPRDRVRYRQHATNMSRDPLLMLSATLAVLRRERGNLPREYAEDFAAGWQDWCDFYGEQIVERLRHAWRGPGVGRWEIAAGGALARWCPQVLKRHLGRKLARVLHGVPPSPIEPGRFAVAALRGPGETAR